MCTELTMSYQQAITEDTFQPNKLGIARYYFELAQEMNQEFLAIDVL